MSRARRSTSSRSSSRARGREGWRHLLRRLLPKRGRSGALVGRDFAARYGQREQWQRLATPLAVLGLIAALGLTALRNDIMRMEYDLAKAGKQEQTLLELQRSLTVEHRQLLAPGRLYEIARERGFVRPARVIDLEAEPRLATEPFRIAAGAESRP